MVAPLIAAGARIVGKRAAAKTAARRGTKRAVQNSARHTAAASPRTAGAYARTGRTTLSGVQNVERYTTEGTARTSKVSTRNKQALPHRDNLGKKALRILRNRMMARAASENSVSGTIESAKEKINVIAASEAILTWYVPFYLWLQLPFAVLAILALLFEGALSNVLWGLLNLFSPGQGLFYIGMFTVIGFGIISMMIASATYTLRSISVFSGNWRLGGMILCTALHFIPVFNLVPFVGIWVGIVVWSYR